MKRRNLLLFLIQVVSAVFTVAGTVFLLLSYSPGNPTTEPTTPITEFAEEPFRTPTPTDRLSIDTPDVHARITPTLLATDPLPTATLVLTITPTTAPATAIKTYVAEVIFAKQTIDAQETELATRAVALRVVAARATRIFAVQTTRIALQTTRIAEQNTRIVEQGTDMQDQAAWIAEQSSQIEEIQDPQAFRSVNAPAPPMDWTIANTVLLTIISAATFAATTVYRMWDEKRVRATHELTVAKTQLEIEKLRKEIGEAEQKKEKRKP